MTKEEFLKGITFLTIAYNKEFSQEQMGVWYEFFKETSYDDFKNAVKRIIPIKQYMPSIAELKQEIVLSKNPLLQLNAEEEWCTVLNAIRKYGSYREIEAMNSFNPYTRYIVRQIGYQKLCMSESIQWEKKEFIGLFNTKIERDENALMLSEPQMSLSEIMRVAEFKNKQEEIEDKNILTNSEPLQIGVRA